ncbi:MAG: ribosome biogenesis GTPase Der [Chloroflexi bacterium]|nr:ribosome biogenesis GTPase Der [Chloroflexota bacterium]MBT4516110.1 ribosome biogenesis GTPase Der [Chloroflexota bacterium]MBT6681962.1 ribosome biogenesis GTPase Der [Chloroflexota bacterium]
MAIPVIAIVGRPNVGKSTLFNRLAGERIAVVSDIAGTTRDRVSADASWGDDRYILVDTAGIEGNSEDIFWPDMQSQVLKALDEADLLIFVTDTGYGLTDADRDAANLIRRYNKPVVLAANKADNVEREQQAVEAYELDLGDPIPISAYHNIGIGDLMDVVMDSVATDDDEEVGSDVRISIVGRPNVGKSALLNALTGEERALVSDIPGTTRDSIDSRYRYVNGDDESDLMFIDTAGLRRRGKTEQGIEKYSALRTIQAIERSHVSLIVLDASEMVTAQDLHVGGFASEASRGLVVVVNKWDLSRELKLTREEAEEEIRDRFKFLPNSSIVFTSALTGRGLDRLLKATVDTYAEWSKRVAAGDLTRVVIDALATHPPPRAGYKRVRLRKVAQTRTGPPTFTFHMANPDLIHFSYRRYLDNRLRDAFGFDGSPLRLRFVGGA